MRIWWPLDWTERHDAVNDAAYIYKLNLNICIIYSIILKFIAFIAINDGWTYGQRVKWSNWLMTYVLFFHRYRNKNNNFLHDGWWSEIACGVVYVRCCCRSNHSIVSCMSRWNLYIRVLYSCISRKPLISRVRIWFTMTE